MAHYECCDCKHLSRQNEMLRSMLASLGVSDTALKYALASNDPVDALQRWQLRTRQL